MVMARTRREFYNGQSLTLPVLLHRFLGQKCTHPLDSITSLLCLLPAESATLQVDNSYTETNYRPFLNAALNIIWTSQNLDILSFYSSFDTLPTDDRRTVNTLHSWVSKFTCRVDVVPLTVGIFDSQNSLDLFTATGTISRALITWHNELLGVRGYTIDRIEKMYFDGVWNMFILHHVHHLDQNPGVLVFNLCICHTGDSAKLSVCYRCLSLAF